MTRTEAKEVAQAIARVWPIEAYGLITRAMQTHEREVYALLVKNDRLLPQAARDALMNERNDARNLADALAGVEVEKGAVAR